MSFSTSIETQYDAKLFQCQLCDKQFYNKNELSVHRWTHTAENLTKLLKSDVIAVTSVLQKNDVDEKIFKCRQCLKKFDLEKDLLNHLEIYKNELLKCQFCEKVFGNKNVLSKHRRTHTIQNIAALIQTCNTGDEPVNPDDQPVSTCDEPIHTSDAPFGEKLYKCKICTKTFTQKPYARKHMKRVHKIIFKRNAKVNKKCVKQFKKLTKKDEVIGHGESVNKIKCQFCDRSFRSIKTVTVHEKNTHLDPKRFKCKFCEMTFEWQRSAGRHAQVAHFDKLKFHCSLCDQRFVDQNHLNYHETYHLGSRFKCQFCDQQFPRKEYLERHLFRHPEYEPVEDNPFICKTCGVTFTRKHSRRKHMEAFHNGEDAVTKNEISENNVKCKTDHEQKNHLNNEFKCQSCDQVFQQKEYLERHLISHTGKHPYKCKFCEESFVTQRRATLHEKAKHLKKEPFQPSQLKCNLCPKEFERISFLKKHQMAKHHGDEMPIFKIRFCD